MTLLSLINNLNQTSILTFNDAELNDDDTIAGINCQNGSLIKVVNKA